MCLAAREPTTCLIISLAQLSLAARRNFHGFRVPRSGSASWLVRTRAALGAGRKLLTFGRPAGRGGHLFCAKPRPNALGASANKNSQFGPVAGDEVMHLPSSLATLLVATGGGRRSSRGRHSIKVRVGRKLSKCAGGDLIRGLVLWPGGGRKKLGPNK